LHLGKTVVKAKDTPNFIANRIGVFTMLDTMKIASEQGLGLEEVDALTGPTLGWPKTATFRLADLVGVDVVAHVAHNFAGLRSDERPDVRLPEFMERMVAEGRIGDKAGQGFYTKRGSAGKEERLTLDLSTFDYVAAKEAAFPELASLQNLRNAQARLRALFAMKPKENRASGFYWALLPDLWSYAANRLGEVSESLADIDLAMMTGFNWQLGPFAMWDAAGVENTVATMRSMKKPVPRAVETLLGSGGKSWYRADGNEYFDVVQKKYVPVPRSPRELRIEPLRATHMLKGNRSVSLIDLGDGIACLELHSKMNSLGRDSAQFLEETLSSRGTSEAVRGFVIGTVGDHFSVGANLAEALALIEARDWQGVEEFLVGFQGMTRAIKFADKPVVAAISGMCLGGGAEVALHAAAREAHLELSMGLVEAGVGLIPGGGGCKEMTIRSLTDDGDPSRLRRGDDPDLQRDLTFAFETIAMAKVSSSAPDARRMRLLKPGDGIVMNRAHLLANAKKQALALVDHGYRAPQPLASLPAPGRSVLSLLRLRIHLMREGQFISDYDAHIAEKLAFVLSGGDVLDGTLVSEEELLGLEREAFLSLCGERSTHERIAYMLKTGKPLRN
jgi:3-hydroxyacyl-CoA dehydrogenase